MKSAPRKSVQHGNFIWHIFATVHVEVMCPAPYYSSPFLYGTVSERDVVEHSCGRALTFEDYAA